MGFEILFYAVAVGAIVGAVQRVVHLVIERR